MAVRMTETAIAKALKDAQERGRFDLADAGCEGLRLRVTPAGSTTWILACRDKHGRMRRFTLGSYSRQEGGIGIADARIAARAMREKVREGADPTAERRRDRDIGKAAKAGIGTLAAVLDSYGEAVGNQQKAWPESRKRIDVVFKALLGKPIAALTLGEMQLAADKYSYPKSSAFAVRTIRPALKWAAAPGRSYLAAQLANLATPATVERRKRILSRTELAALLPTLRASCRPYAAALHFMLLTLTRRQETCSAQWRDVDWKAGTFSIRDTKNGEPHLIPLPRQAVALLRARLPKDDTGATIDPAPDTLIFATSTGGALPNWDREAKRLIVASGLATENEKTGEVTMKDGSLIFTRHDLRRTGATMLGEMGELPDIIEAALNHVSIHSPLAATYNRSRYRPQVAAALQRLADALDGIEAGAAKVVPLRAAARQG